MKKTFTTVLFLSILLSVSAHAQFGRDRRPAMERIESFKKLRMMEALKLDENLSIKFFARYNKHQEAMHGLEKDRNDLIDKLDLQVREKTSDENFDQTFSALLDIDKRISETRSKLLDDLKEILTRKQIADYIIFERNFARDLRDIIRDVQRERMREH